MRAYNKDKTDTTDNKTDKENKTDQTDDKAAGETSVGQVQESGLTGTLKYLDVSVEKAEQLVRGNNDAELMNGALETGDLQMTIYNDFADTKQENADNGSYQNTSVPNFEIVWDFLLTGEEKMEMLQGNAPAGIDLHKIGRAHV